MRLLGNRKEQLNHPERWVIICSEPERLAIEAMLRNQANTLRNRGTMLAAEIGTHAEETTRIQRAEHKRISELAEKSATWAEEISPDW